MSRSLSFRPPSHVGVGGAAEGAAFDGPPASVGGGFVSPLPRPGSGSIRRRAGRPRARGPGPAIHGDNFDGSYAVPNPASTFSDACLLFKYVDVLQAQLDHVYCSSMMMYVDVLQAQLDACVLFKYVDVCSSVRSSVYELFMYADVLEAQFLNCSCMLVSVSCMCIVQVCSCMLIC